MIFSGIKEVRIPEGIVKQIACGATVLWEANSEPFIYTGNYTESAVTINSKAYTLYTLTTSGTLTIKNDALFWMNGGGAGGGIYDERTTCKSGNGGGGGYVLSGNLEKGKHAIVIGPGGASNTDGSETSINGTLIAGGGKADGDGGSGGGGSVAAMWMSNMPTELQKLVFPGGTGAGVSTYPFGLTTLKAHSGGGGSGGSVYEYGGATQEAINGVSGGTNGGNGSTGYEGDVAEEDDSATGGTGGTYGGGRGGSAPTRKYDGTSWHTSNGYAGTFYGGGGGGGGVHYTHSTYYGTGVGIGGNGYQGVVYIAVPAA